MIDAPQELTPSPERKQRKRRTANERYEKKRRATAANSAKTILKQRRRLAKFCKQRKALSAHLKSTEAYLKFVSACTKDTLNKLAADNAALHADNEALKVSHAILTEENRSLLCDNRALRQELGLPVFDVEGKNEEEHKLE